MREIIAKILGAEAEGKKIVETAKMEAEHILAEARVKGQETSDRLRKETQLEITRALEECTKAIQQEEESALARASGDMSALFPLDQPAREQAVLAGLLSMVRSHDDDPNHGI
ncbi:MAG: hypothetical protein WCS52_03530 [bacterium]